MAWLEIQVAAVMDEAAATYLRADAIAELLQGLPEVQAVAQEQLGDPAQPDPAALLPAVIVKGYVPEERDSAEFRARAITLLAAAGFPLPQFRRLKDEDWANAWKDHYHPLRIGRRFWIQPSWRAILNPQPDDLIIQLDPGMAFGTGAHPTTQLCLAALEQLVQPGDRVLDLGCGSGILAIGAAHLGASRVLALDNDPVAVEVACANILNNHVADRVEAQLGVLGALTEMGWQVIAANILAAVIQELLAADHLLDHLAPGGRLILSGIIPEQAAAIVASLERLGANVTGVVEQEGWVAVLATTGRLVRTNG